MLRLHLLKLVKFGGVLLFVGGALAAFLATDLAARRAAVHRIGSPGLVATWVAGYLLATTLAWTLRAPWLWGAFACTLAAQIVLVWFVARERRAAPAAIAVAALLVATLVLMIWKPR